MNNRKIITHALAGSLLTALYVILIGILVSHGQQIFGDDGKPFVPIMLLMIFVFSATVCSVTFFGYPVMWFLEGHKKEAMKTVGYEVLFFFLTIVVVYVVLYH